MPGELGLSFEERDLRFRAEKIGISFLEGDGNGEGCWAESDTDQVLRVFRLPRLRERDSIVLDRFSVFRQLQGPELRDFSLGMVLGGTKHEQVTCLVRLAREPSPRQHSLALEARTLAAQPGRWSSRLVVPYSDKRRQRRRFNFFQEDSNFEQICLR